MSRPRRTLVLAATAAAVCAGSALAAAPAASAATPLSVGRNNAVLTADVDGPVVVTDDDFTLDCQGHAIVGNGEPIGLDLTGRRGVTVLNCGWIYGFQTGISLVDATGNTLRGRIMGAVVTRAMHNAGDGIDMTRASGNLLDHVDASGNGGDGLKLTSASGNTFRRVFASHNGEDGFDLEHADDNVFEDIMADSNADSGVELDDADRNIVTESTFYQNDDAGIDGDRSTGNRIEDNDIRENIRYGIHLVNGSVDNVVRRNIVNGNGANMVVTGRNVVEDNFTP